jgi:hypothetical protein
MVEDVIKEIGEYIEGEDKARVFHIEDGVAYGIVYERYGRNNPMAWAVKTGIRIDYGGSDPKFKLRPVPKKIKIEGYFSIYSDGSSVMYQTKAEADYFANVNKAFEASMKRTRLACKFVSFEVEEGEGLET